MDYPFSALPFLRNIVLSLIFYKYNIKPTYSATTNFPLSGHVRDFHRLEHIYSAQTEKEQMSFNHLPF